MASSKFKYFLFSRDYHPLLPLINQAVDLVDIYLRYGIEPLVLLRAAVVQLRVAPAYTMEWLYYNAIKLAIIDRTMIRNAYHRYHLENSGM